MQLPNRYEQSGQALVTEGAGKGMVVAEASAADDGLNFGRLLSLLRRRYRLFLLCFSTVMLIGIAMTMLQSKVYQATATVLLRNSGKSVDEKVSDETGDQTVKGDADVATELQVIQSLDISKRVVRSLRLIENPLINPVLQGQGSLVDRTIGTAPASVDPKTWSPEQRAAMESSIARLLRSGLMVARIGTSYTATISYNNEDPEMAATIANAYAREYARSQVNDKIASTNEATTFLTKKVEELRQQATADFAAVQNYRIRNGLLSSAATALTEQDISVYNQQVVAAQADAAADAARLATAKDQLRSGSAGDDVGEALSSSVVSSLRSQRAQLAGQVAELSARYGSRHPDLISAKDKLASIDAQIQAEIDRVISNLDSRAAVSRQRVASLGGSLGSAKGELVRNNSALVKLADLQRRADASQGLYESYLARLRQLAANSGVEQAEARVLSEASVPWTPDRPKVALNLALAGLVGLIFGLGAALVVEMQYKGLTTASDVEKRVGLPYLGMTPDNTSFDKHAATPLATVEQLPDSILAEAVRGIHAATSMPISGRGRVLAITSALPDEGKSALAAMLGQTASTLGERTVIIDCDIILHGLSTIYGMKSGPGLREVIAGKCNIEDALRWHSDGTAILPITSRAEAGERLISNGAIHAIVAQLKERFDFVVLDCPPLLSIAEAREIVALADGIIVAVQWRKTSDEAVRAAVRLLPTRLSNYTGAVLTRVNLRKQARYANDASLPYTSYERYAVQAA